MSLENLRDQIDQIDRDLARLLNKRIEVARRIGAEKARNGRKIFDAEREKCILDRLLSKNRGPIEDAELAGIYRIILRTSRRHQRKVRR